MGFFRSFKGVEFAVWWLKKNPVIPEVLTDDCKTSI
jgi:hypothetical protein